MYRWTKDNSWFSLSDMRKSLAVSTCWMTRSLLCLALVGLFAAGSNCQNIHEGMSSEDLMRVFQVKTHQEVPQYEVVRLRSLSKREATTDDVKEVHLSAFGRSLSLKLKRNDHFQKKLENFKVIEAESTASGLKFHEMPQDNETDLGTSFHDESNMAAVMLTEKDGRMLMDGTIGNDLIVRPLDLDTSETDDSYVDDEMFLDEDDFEAFKHNQQNTTRRTAPKNAGNMQYKSRRKIPKLTENAHVVFKRKPGAIDESHSDFLPMEPTLELINGTNHRRSKRQAPDTVWPEVLLVVDYDTFILHNGNSHDIKKYFVSFWNGVDLRYKLLTHPVIKISLAGMIVAKDRDATPYLEQNRLRPPNGDAVDAAGALTDLGKYLYREDRLPTYDLAVVITKLDMCRRRFQGGRCNRGTAGFAYVGGACVVNKRLEKVNSVAIIEDSGGFSGIIVAAHEVGHLLGCVHDGSPPPSYLGGPGATRCPWEDGFIMSDLRHTERGFRWSSCSVEQFKHFLNGETATCLFNFPHENDLLARILPGTMMTLDQQCKRDRGTTACFRDQRVCAQLFCFDSSSGYCVSYRPAAEGSPCGDGHVCKNGRCLAELENIIPDYTHVTQTFAARPPTDTFIRRSDDSEDVDAEAHSTTRDRAATGTTRDKESTPTTPRQRNGRRPQSPTKPQRESRVTAKPPPKTSVQRVSSENCQDVAQNLGGSMNCKEFLEQFGYRYCSYDYVKKNCCHSHSVMCNKG